MGQGWTLTYLRADYDTPPRLALSRGDPPAKAAANIVQVAGTDEHVNSRYYDERRPAQPKTGRRRRLAGHARARRCPGVRRAARPRARRLFRLSPPGEFEVTRRSVPGSNVLETTLTTTTGVVTVRDALSLQDGGTLSWIEFVPARSRSSRRSPARTAWRRRDR